MTLINHQQIIDGLFQLGSEREQRRLWLAEGPKGQNEMFSFVEAWHELFTDSVLLDKLCSQGTEFGMEVDAMLMELYHLTDAIDVYKPEEEIVADPRMIMVRKIASTVREHIMSMGRKNSSRILDRVVEWRDEERQRMLWLADAEEPPRSSPHCADWHLFHGKDYWGYLDLGANKRELSTRFWDLSLLVNDLRTFNRPPESVLADPLMEPIRERAARIASRLGIARRTPT